MGGHPVFFCDGYRTRNWCFRKISDKFKLADINLIHSIDDSTLV